MTAKRFKIGYLNCTACAPHVGCLAVTDSHFRELVGAGYEISPIIFADHPWALYGKMDRDEAKKRIHTQFIDKALKEADAIVINGEGTIHGRPGIGLLYVADALIDLGKPVFLVNASVFNVDGCGPLLKRLTDICVREPISQRYLNSMGVESRLSLDSFVDAAFDNSAAYSFNGAKLVTDWHQLRDHDVGKCALKLLHSTEDRYRFFPLNHPIQLKLWQSAVAMASTSSLIVTGRYHGVYLAALAGRPFVALPSNTRKIEGLVEMSGLPLPVSNNLNTLDRDIRFARTNAKIFEEFRSFLNEKKGLLTFHPLMEALPGVRTKPEILNSKLEKIDQAVIDKQVGREFHALEKTLEKRVKGSKLQAYRRNAWTLAGKTKRMVLKKFGSLIV